VITVELDDLELPVSTITLRLRHISASYIRATVPDPLRYTSAILTRMSERMYIYQDGEEIIYANPQNIFFTRGEKSNVLNIAGTRFITHSSPQTVNLSGISNIKKDGLGRFSVDCVFDNNVKPNDTAVLPDDRGQFTIDFINVTITKDQAVMNVQGE